MKDRFSVQWRWSRQRPEMLCSLVRTLLLSPHRAPWWKKSLINRLRPPVRSGSWWVSNRTPDLRLSGSEEPPTPLDITPHPHPHPPLLRAAFFLLSGEDRGGTGKSSEKVRGSVRVLWHPPPIQKKKGGGAENPEVSLLAWLRYSFIVNNDSDNNGCISSRHCLLDSKKNFFGGGREREREGGDCGFVWNNTDMFYFTFLQRL